MADNSAPTAMPGIAALPPTTARQIGSGQVLVDPSSLVKELIDNALDARARSIFVDIAANSIDSIQVKDDGHGIPAEDRSLVCRRNCTSKIRDLYDLKEVGGKWLGFRGEALSSMAEMSGALSVTTRVEGEPVAVRLKYGRNGELGSTERDSHPVGTTVKVTHFFEHIPVRKQTATKNAAKCLVRIRRLMQAYALARPAVRFRLHVLKAKSNKGDFIYAPKASSNVQDAVLKVISKDCALQCDWTALESDGFEIHAYLPKPSASGSKIANYGAFISVDSRPVSSSRGTIKQIVAAFNERLRKSSHYLMAVKDPFFCMNIICPPDSYDPNIEPAKDDVLFDDAKTVLDLVDKLLRSYYPEVGPPTSAQQYAESDVEVTESHVPYPAHLEATVEVVEVGRSVEQPQEPRWRSSMYGIDEDDLEHLQEDQPLVLEEEDGGRAAEVSNPWTIARMNATIKPKAPATNCQLLSPAKSSGDVIELPSSPSVAKTPVRQSQPEPLTPQTSSGPSNSTPLLDGELRQSIGLVSRGDHEEETHRISRDIHTFVGNGGSRSGLPISEHAGIEQSHNLLTAKKPRCGQVASQVSPASEIRRKRPKRLTEVSSGDPFQSPDDTWFGQPMRGSQPSQPIRRQKRRKEQVPSSFASDMMSSPRRSILEASDSRLYSEDNTDIRSFFGQTDNGRANNGHAAMGASFVPINSPSSAANPVSRNVQDPFRPLTIRERPFSQPISSKSNLIAPRETRDDLHICAEDATSARRRDRTQRFDVYEDGGFQSPIPRPLSAGSERPPLMPIRSNGVRTALDLYSNDKLTPDSRDMTAYFKAYQNRENAPNINLPSSICRQEPRIAPPHELTSKTRRHRRRTTDAAQRTKSSKLPLERVPHGYHLQDIVLTMHLSVPSIIQYSRKLDMGRNSLDYNYSAQDSFDTFAEPVSERKIMAWVLDLDGLLHHHFERLPAADVRSMLHEAIQRGMDARKSEGVMRIVEPVSAPAHTTARVRDIDSDNCMTAEPGYHQAVGDVGIGAGEPAYIDFATDQSGAAKQSLAKAEEDRSDFDMSQFVEFDMNSVENEMGASKKADEEFGDEIEDDMLLDL